MAFRLLYIERMTSEMEKRKLGNSDMYITRVGIGAWAMCGGGPQWGWGPQRDDSIAAIHEALDRGVNWMDTAAVYGSGHSEEVVGRAIRDRTLRPFVFTKCGRAWDSEGRVTGSLKPSSIRRECEASLRRLKVDVIDLYQIHWPELDVDIEEAWTEMARLKEEGKVRYIGVSNFSVEQMQRAQRIAPITSIQSAYSLSSRTVEDSELPFAAKHGIGVIVYSPMYSGLLSGTINRERIANAPLDAWGRNDSSFNEPPLSENLRLADLLNQIGARHGRSAGQVAIAWTLHNTAVTAAIVAMRSAEQTTGVASAGDLRLTSDELAEIESAARTTADLAEPLNGVSTDDDPIFEKPEWPRPVKS